MYLQCLAPLFEDIIIEAVIINAKASFKDQILEMLQFEDRGETFLRDLHITRNQ